MRSWMPVAVAFVVSGVLELLFCGLSAVGSLFGGAATFATLTGELEREAALLGPLLLVFYPLWFVVTVIAGPVHLVAGAAFLAGRRNRRLLWAGTILSALPMVTVYCAPTSLIALVLGLVTALTREPAAS